MQGDRYFRAYKHDHLCVDALLRRWRIPYNGRVFCKIVREKLHAGSKSKLFANICLF